jgi:hypothetical protein
VFISATGPSEINHARAGGRGREESGNIRYGFLCYHLARRSLCREIHGLESFDGREVTIWPDADEPGLEAALKIREYLPQARILDIQGRLKGWDLADAVAEGINPMEFIANCPVLPALEADSDNPAAEEQTEKHSKQADRAIRLGEECELFHCADAGFARLLIDKHYEVWPLRGKQFRNWLQQQFYSTTGSVLYNQALDDALGALEGKAKFKSQEWPVHVRLAGNDTCIYLDLGDPEWQIVEITAEGWQIVKEAQVRFRRPPGMEALPIPVSGGKLDTHLGPFLNMADEDRKLFISCLVAALRPTGPYPILNLQGEQGSAKSSAAWVFRQCIDPNTAPLRSTPREEQDMIIAAKNGWVIAYDNLSHLSGWVSDALCRLSTGSGYSTRELYTNYEEVIFQAQRPIILNGIEDLATRGDLLDRSVILNLPPVEEHKRMTEKYFQDQFRQEQPLILGALLDAVAAGIRNLPETNLDNPPRMADFATWVTACEKAIGWEPGTFLQVYRMNRADANSLALDANPIVPELIKLLAAGSWLGTATDLHEALNKQVSENKYKSRAWPKSGRAISASLKRLAPNLRAVGIEVEWDREPGIARTRVLRLKVKSNVLSSFCVLKPLLRPKIEDTKDAKDERTQDFTFYQKFPSATGGQGLSQNKPGNAILTTNIHQAVGASGSVGSFQLIISQSELMRGSLGG